MVFASFRCDVKQMCLVEKQLLATKDWGLQHFSLQPLLLILRFLFFLVVCFLFFAFLVKISHFLCAAGFSVGGRNLILSLPTWLLTESDSSKHLLISLFSPLPKISISDTLLMWHPMGVWYLEINYRSHWPHWPRPNPLLSNLPGAHNEFSHSLSSRNWSRRVKRSSKLVSDATRGGWVGCWSVSVVCGGIGGAGGRLLVVNGCSHYTWEHLLAGGEQRTEPEAAVFCFRCRTHWGLFYVDFKKKKGLAKMVQLK